MEKEFHLLLPSNSPTIGRIPNKTSNFTIHLPRRFDLKGAWKVALVGITIPCSWYNVREDDVFAFFKQHPDSEKSRKFHKETFNICPKLYLDVDDLVKTINDNIFILVPSPLQTFF